MDNPSKKNKTIMDSDPSSEEQSPIPEFCSSKEVRNWLEIPPEIMSMIFTKVGAIDILLAVQSVCSAWRKLAKEPELFRSLAICSFEEFITDEERDRMVNIAKEAVNRSCGQLVEFSVHHFPADEILKHITQKQSPLRRLRFASCFDLSGDVVIDMGKKLPLLEELEICYCYFDSPEEVVENFGRSCLLLKSFRLNYWDHNQKDDLSRIVCDEEARAIGQCMPELRYLNLFRTYLTDNGLWAILDGCPHLNFLDLSRCSNLTFAWGLVKMCVDRKIQLRLLDVASIEKLLTRMIRQVLSLLKECVRLIQEAELEAVYDGEEDFEAGFDVVEDLEVGFDAVEDLETGYTVKLYATCGSNKVLLEVLQNELIQMQSMLNVLSQENVFLMEAIQVEQDLQVVEAHLQDLMSRISRMMATICSFTPWLRSRHSSKM